jgi:hypothetical protein
MTTDDIKAAIELARESLHKGGAEYNECDLSTLAAALLALAEERARMEKVVEAFANSVDAADRADDARGRGGQQVPFHGEFCNAPPSTRSVLRRYVREFKAALDARSQGGGA